MYIAFKLSCLELLHHQYVGYRLKQLQFFFSTKTHKFDLQRNYPLCGVDTPSGSDGLTITQTTQLRTALRKLTPKTALFGEETFFFEEKKNRYKYFLQNFSF